MTKQTKRVMTRARYRKGFLAVASELRAELAEINHKLDHLIRNYRKFYLTSDFSHSSHREFDD